MDGGRESTGSLHSRSPRITNSLTRKQRRQKCLLERLRIFRELSNGSPRQRDFEIPDERLFSRWESQSFPSPVITLALRRMRSVEIKRTRKEKNEIQHANAKENPLPVQRSRQLLRGDWSEMKKRRKSESKNKTHGTRCMTTDESFYARSWVQVAGVLFSCNKARPPMEPGAPARSNLQSGQITTMTTQTETQR